MIPSYYYKKNITEIYFFYTNIYASYSVWKAFSIIQETPKRK